MKKGMKVRIAACIIVAILLSAETYAQDTDSVSEKSIKIDGVEITAGRQQGTTVAHTLDLIYLKKEALLQSQGNTFINTLEKLPGISAINTGVGISKPVIRGLSLNRVIVNEYGIKQEGQQWGVDHGLEIDQYNVDRVEIIKGPVSVIYGSDGIGGVINILPPVIPFTDTVSTEIITTYKSNNDLYGISGKVLYGKKDFYLLARATYQDYASYKVPAEEFVYNGYVLPIYNNRLKNTGGNELNFSLLTGIRRKWGNSSIYASSYQQKAGFFAGAFGIPRAYQLHDDGNYRNIILPQQLITHTKIISNTHIILPEGKIEADLGFQKNLRKELSPPHAHGYGPAPQGNEALKLSLYTFSGNMRYLYYGHEKWIHTSGISFQYQHNVRDGYEFLIPSYQYWQTGLYHFAEYHHNDHWLFTAGLRADYGMQHAAATYVARYDSTGLLTDSTLRSPDISRNYFNLSGSAGSVWNLSRSWKIKINAGTAYRIPVMAELAANGVHHGTFRHELGDASLEAERGYMADIGASYKRTRISVNATPFLNYFTNYIYLSPSARFSPLPDAGQIYRYTGAEALFTGIELSMDWDLLKTFKSSSSLEYVWNKNLESRLPLPFTPPFSLLEELSWQPTVLPPTIFNNTLLSLSGQYFAPQRRVDRNEPVTKGYFLLNFSLSNTFPLGKQRLTLYFQLRNLTNAVYMNNMSRYRILNLPEQGFNTQLMLRWEW